MAIYNPVLGEISAGVGISFTQNYNGVVVISAGGSGVITSISGTINRISTTTTGSTGIIDIAANAVLPGTGGVTLPQGNTSTRAGNAGTIRYNSQTTVFEGTVDGSNWAAFQSGSTGVLSVSGATGYITSTGGTTPVISIDSTYVGQTSITKLGTIDTGTWSATNLTESQITNLVTDLAAKADLVGGVLKSTEVPTNIITSVNSVTTINNAITLTTDNITEGTTNKYYHNILPIAESDVTNLVTDLAATEKTANKNVASGYCPLNSSILVPISNLASLTPTANQAIIATSSSAASWQTIDHVNLNNIGTNTHSQIDTFIASKDQASGIAGLDSNTLLKVSEFPNFGNTITFYVDCKYALGSNDGSILKPYTTISAALANITVPVDNTDLHLADKYIINVAGGQYDESLTINIGGGRHVTLIADGLVFLGYTTVQYLEAMSAAGHVRDVNIQIMRNSGVTATYYRSTCIFNTSQTTTHGQGYTHTGLEMGWKVSGILNIAVLANSSSADSEIELVNFRACDFSDTGVGGSRASTGYFINNTSTYVGNWNSNFNLKLKGCRGNAINFPYSTQYPNFNLLELDTCYLVSVASVGKMGLMRGTLFFGSSGVSANTTTGTTYQTYPAQMIDCVCLSGSTFSTTVVNTLYVDNATLVKSGGAITTSGSLTLNIDYGFPNKTTFTSLTNGQAITWDGTNNKFINTTLASGGVTSNIATTNQTTVSSATGAVTIGLANNAVLPGTAGVTLPGGNTAARAGTAGTIRYNSQTNVFEGTVDGSVWSAFQSGSTGVLSVSGAAGYITSTGGTTPVISIDSTYVGQTSITKLGTIGTGTWYGGVIGGTYGGTGVNNGASTITLGGNFATSGTYAATLTLTGATNVTLPTSGTLATTASIPTLPLSLSNGGLNANLTASNGGIFYSTGTAGAVLSGTATANLMLMSSSNTAPIWSTAVYPASSTINQLLYSSANNVITGLATVNSISGKPYVLTTSTSGVPTWVIFNMSNLFDVTISSLVSGNVLQWNGTAWVPASVGGNGSLSSLTDCTIVSAQGTQGLLYNASTSKWNNQFLQTSSLADISYTSLANGNLLKYSYSQAAIVVAGTITYTTTDFSTFTTIGSTYSFFGIAYNGINTYVGLTNSAVYTSSDCSNWTQQTTNLFSILNLSAGGNYTRGCCIIWDGAKFLANGTNVTNSIAYSYNGITWTGCCTQPVISCIAYNGSKYVGIGNSQVNACLVTSTDGIIWATSSYVSLLTNLTRWGAQVCYNGTTWLATACQAIKSTDNGVTWTTTGTVNEKIGCAYSAYYSKWYISDYANQLIYYSSNLTSWTSVAGGSVSTSTLWAYNAYITGMAGNVVSSNAISTNGGTSYSTYTLPNSGYPLFIGSLLTYNKWNNVASTSAILTDFGISSAASGDILQYNSTASQWQNSQNLATLITTVSGISNNLIVASELMNTSLSVATNNTVVVSYTDNVIGNLCFSNNSTSTYQSPVSITQGSSNAQGTWSISGTQVVGPAGLSSSAIGQYARLNIKYSIPFICSSVYGVVSWGLTGAATATYSYYGTNSSVAYTDTNYDTTNLTLLYTTTVIYPSAPTINVAISTSTAYQYYVVIIYLTAGAGQRPLLNTVQIQRAAGGYIPLTSGSDYSINTDASTGYPVLKYLDATTINLSYIYERIAFSELQRRIYPVVRTSSDLVLAPTSTALTGYGTSWNVENNNGTLNVNYNGSTKASFYSSGGMSIPGGIVGSHNGINYMPMELVTFVSLANYGSVTLGYAYFMSGLFTGIFVDLSAAGYIGGTANLFIQLPALTNGLSIYIQTIGTPNSYTIGVMDNVNNPGSNSNIFFASGSFGGNFSLNSSNANSTYMFTYYSPSSNNPWNTGVGTTANSWQIQKITNNYIPMLNNIALLGVYSENSPGLVGNVSLPMDPINFTSYLNLGQELYVKDLGGYLSASNLVISDPHNSNTINGNSSQTYSTNNGSYHYVYVGGGSSGNLVLL